MSATNRAKKIAKLQTVLKKNYQPIKPPTNRSVLEHLVFACCLEDSKYDPANDAFARLQEIYTGWNEIRVTTVSELAEEISDLFDPTAAATRVKKTLYNVFESQYSWDLEYLRKENLGKATQKLMSYKSVTPFVSSYVVQSALGGHSIPLDGSTMDLMLMLDVVTEKEAAQGTVPGLERAISKTAGVDFGSILHQLAADFRATPFSTNLRTLITSIDPIAKDRFPKRQSKKKETEVAPETESVKAASVPAKSATKKTVADKNPAKKASAKKAPEKKIPEKKTAKPATSAKAAAPAKKAVKKKSVTKKSVTKSAPGKTAATAKKTPNKKLSKKKPR